MNKITCSLALSLLATAGAAQATTVDLTTFTSTVGTNSSIATTADLSTLVGTTTLTGNVSRLVSFQWDFSSPDYYVEGYLDDYSYFQTSAGVTNLDDVGAVGHDGDSGWVTFTFAAPYTGAITFAVANQPADDDVSSTLVVKDLVVNPLVVSPVPEPHDYAMLLAGLGLVGTVVRRRANQGARYDLKQNGAGVSP